MRLGYWERNEMKAKQYIDKQELHDELCKSKQTGQPTVGVCEMFRRMSDHVLRSPKFRGYPKDIREDMGTESLIKCINQIANYDDTKPDCCFAYFSRCVYCAIIDYLRKYYRRLNNERQFMRDYADWIEQESPRTARAIRNNLLDENTTHQIERTSKPWARN